jgi:hypothetical protein
MASATGGSLTVRSRLEAAFFDACPRAVASGLLLVSACAHLKNSYFFLGTVYSYQIVQPSLGIVIAAFLPFLQIVLALCLLSNAFMAPVVLLSSLLFSLFIAVQLYAVHARLDITCGCFGVDSAKRVGLESLLVAGSGWISSLLLLLRGFNGRRPSKLPSRA